jgi:hypothetical protein
VGRVGIGQPWRHVAEVQGDHRGPAANCAATFGARLHAESAAEASTEGDKKAAARRG